MAVWSELAERKDPPVRFFASQLYCELAGVGVSRTQVWDSVRLLEEFGMVRRIAPPSGDRAVWYERVEDSAGWALTRAAIELCRSQDD